MSRKEEAGEEVVVAEKVAKVVKNEKGAEGVEEGIRMLTLCRSHLRSHSLERSLRINDRWLFKVHNLSLTGPLEVS